MAERRTIDGRAAVVRNGYLPQRAVLTGIGAVPIEVPKVRSRSDEAAVFRSGLVPRYVRRSKSIDVVLPWLYLHGVSTNNMAAAVSVLVGPQAANLSAPVVARLKQVWGDEYEGFRKRRWDNTPIVYLWADGVYSGLRAEEQQAVRTGGDRRRCPGTQTLAGTRRRRARINPELARGAAATEETGPGATAAAGHG